MRNDKAQGEASAPLRRFWVMGAGRFGQIAVNRILRHFPQAHITVVDRESLMPAADRVTMVRAEGVEWLVDALQEGRAVDMVVPAIPSHVAYEWMVQHLKRQFTILPLEPDDHLLSRLPHPIRGSAGRIYVSHADFICPDSCAEPENICTHTGKPRPRDLFRLLADLDTVKVQPVVLRSFQLLPGVGGLYPHHLQRALDSVIAHQRQPLMIATACRCHGVLDLIRLHD